MLEIHDLNYKIKTFSLTIKDLKIKNRCIHTILGNSGAGKSTLLNLIAGHIEPLRGEILLNHNSIVKKKPNERNIALIFQNSLLFPHMTVFENISYALKIRKVKKDRIQNEVTLWLNRMDLIGYDNRMPNQLSGGEKKRVAIARALITHPDLILMDEPLNGLDPKLRDEMLDLIKEIQTKTSIAILYITHDFEEALKISDEISVIKNGEIIHSGPPSNLLFKPDDLSIIEFFTYYNTTNVIIKNKKFSLFNKTIETEKEGSYQCILPPQGVTITLGNAAEIIEKHYLKYGNIYCLKTKEDTFYAFSQEQYDVTTKVDYTIQSKFINYQKEI